VRLRLKIPQGVDWSLVFIPIFLSIFGIVLIYTITYGNENNIALDQLIFTGVGLTIGLFLTFLDYRIFKSLAWPLYGIGLLLLLIVLFFGSTTFGATRWIDLGFYRLQPSELFKFISLIVIAKYLSDLTEINFKNLMFLVFIIALPLLLILKQPDLGTASVIFIGLIALLIISPLKKIYLIAALGLAIVLSPLGWHFLKPYQKHRIEVFLNPSSDLQGEGYNVNQAKIAVGSGGLLGRGLGKGSQSQLNFLPVAHTDFIFAGTAEATGFVGSFLLILLLVIMIYRAINVAKEARDSFGTYLAAGIGAVFLFQTLVNVGMNMGIMPVTGIPLPFVSYGGSAMLTNFVFIGILQSIYLRHKKIKF